MRVKWIGIGVGITLLLVLIITAVGWMFWQRSMWGYGMNGGGMGMMGNTWNSASCSDEYGGRYSGRRGWGMMGDSSPSESCYIQDGSPVNSGEMLDLDMAKQAVSDYIARSADELAIAEIMEFEQNFYAIVIEEDTHVGAMELLIDKWTGNVGPEMGPNMMWNTKYGMHQQGMMMSPRNTTAVYSDHEMLDIAKAWLAVRKPGVTAADHGDMFYGYMTVHLQENDQISGMLSVNASTGEVWYHTWHGDFITMESFIEEDTHE